MCHLQIRMANSDLPQKCCIIQILRNAFYLFGQLNLFTYLFSLMSKKWELK